MFNNLKEGLGARLKELRKSKGYTQERLAEKLEITPRQLTRIETGENFPSVETLERISLYLEADLKSLFDFSWDKEYSVLTTGTNDKPVFEVPLNAPVIDLSRYARKNKKDEYINIDELINIQNSDESMLQSAKNIQKPFTIVYKDSAGELSHIKTYYPNGKIDTVMSEEKVEAEKIYKSIMEELKPYQNDINKLEYVLVAIKALKSRGSLDELKGLIKGIDIVMGSK